MSSNSLVKMGAYYQSLTLAVAAACLLAPLAALGQGEQKQLGGNELAEQFNKQRELRNSWIRGEAKPTAADVDGLDLIAKYYAYRVTWVILENDNKAMAEAVHSLEEFVKDCIQWREKNGAFVAAMGKRFELRFREVFDLDFLANRKALVNAALMLPSLARLKHNEVGDLLADIIKDEKRHDAVKLHAMRALREFFPVRTIDNAANLDDPSLVLRKQQDLKRIDALATFIERKWQPQAATMDKAPSDKTANEKSPPSKATTDKAAAEKPSDEKAAPLKDSPERAFQAKMERDAVLYLRREAIQTLGLAGHPAVAALRKTGKVEGPVAYTLIRVLLKGKLDPEPGLMEKCEAAIALLNLDCQEIPEYDPSVSLYLVGEFLKEFLSDYRKDFNNFVTPRKGQPNIQAFVAWKAQATRLKAGLKKMTQSAQLTPAAEAAKRLDNGARNLLDEVRLYQNVSNTNELDAAVTFIRPKSGVLFPKVQGPSVDLGK